jgi:hypothetical protein
VINYLDDDGAKDKPFDPAKDKPRTEDTSTRTPKISMTISTPSGVLPVWNKDAYNCHSYVWYGSKGDGSNPNNPKWVDDPSKKVNDATPLKPSEPNKPGDKVTYTKDGKLTHSAIVTEVDQDGNATRCKSKWGELGIHDHHPADVDPTYGTTRQYYRPK